MKLKQMPFLLFEEMFHVIQVKIEVRFGDQLPEQNNLLHIPDPCNESRSPSPRTCQEMLQNKRRYNNTTLLG